MPTAQNTIVVTGGAAGIGFALAEHWLRSGGSVAILDLSEDSLIAAAQALDAPDRLSTYVCDITDAGSVSEVFETICAAGPLHGLANAAGIMVPGASATLPDADFQRMIDVHLGGAMRCCQAAYPALKETGGAIVNFGSVASVTGMPLRASYCAAKAGIGGLTRTLAVEWAPDGIRVNAVAPGYVRTAMTGNLIAAGKIDVAKIEARTPLARFADPSELAKPVAFLLSDAASYITGHTLFVDGGMTIDGNWY